MKSWRIIAVALCVLAGFAGLSESASAGKRLSYFKAQEAALAKAFLMATSDKGFNSWGTGSCRRKGPLTFICVSLVEAEQKDGSKKCRYFFKVKKRGKSVRATYLRRTCVRAPGGGDNIPGEPELVNPDNPFQSGPGPKYCPGTGDKSWNAVPDIVGKTVDEATAVARQHGCTVRVMKIDGVPQIGTADLRYERLNVATEGPEQRITSIDSVA